MVAFACKASAFVVVGTGLALMRGALIQLLWLWFVVPKFGLAELSLPGAIGLGMLTAYLTHQHIPNDDERPFLLKLAETVITAIVLNGFILVAAVIVHGFMA